MKCKNCGQEVQDGWKVCPFCGAEVKAAKTTKKKSEPKDEELFEFSEDTAQFEEAFEKQQTEQTKQAFTFSGDTSEYGDAFDNQLKKQKKDEENAKAKAYAAAKLAEERKAKAEAEAARKKAAEEEVARKKKEAEEAARKKAAEEEAKKRAAKELKEQEEKERQLLLAKAEEINKKINTIRFVDDKGNELKNFKEIKKAKLAYCYMGTYPQELRDKNLYTNVNLKDDYGRYLGTDGYYYKYVSGEEYKVSPIKWYVAVADGGYLYLVAANILSYGKYATTRFVEDGAFNGRGRQEEITNLDVVDFLNYDFYKTAFNEKQKSIIVRAGMQNKIKYSSGGDASTIERGYVFLPKGMEKIGIKKGGVFMDKKSKIKKAYLTPTDYAHKLGASNIYWVDQYKWVWVDLNGVNREIYASAMQNMEQTKERFISSQGIVPAMIIKPDFN